jgi:hypothetical protein
MVDRFGGCRCSPAGVWTYSSGRRGDALPYSSTMYYAFLAYRLAQKTGRSDVCALPSGISVPHMFIVTFVIMLPISLKSGDPEKG